MCVRAKYTQQKTLQQNKTCNTPSASQFKNLGGKKGETKEKKKKRRENLQRTPSSILTAPLYMHMVY